jgi:hypothetical protein
MIGHSFMTWEANVSLESEVAQLRRGDAKRAYGWSYERRTASDGSSACCMWAGITVPREAVRAAIVAEVRRKQ